MASLEFPIALDAVYVGIGGKGGEFPDSETGEMIQYSDALAFDFDTSEGITQRLILRSSKLAQIAKAGVKLEALKRYQDRLRIEGVIVLGERGGRSFFRPISLSLVA